MVISSGAKLWLAILGRGIVAMAFGVVAIASSARMTVDQLSLLYAGYALAEGSFIGLAAFQAGQHRTPRDHSWALVVAGAVSFVAAILAVISPYTLALRVVGGVRAVVASGLEGLWAFGQKRDERQWFVGFGDVGAIIFGGTLLAWPGPAVLALPWLLGIIALFNGAFSIAGAFSEAKAISEPRAAT
ncbi:MAG: DUF308 domain-containing protein [Labilithrix sp.]|nr:DUF308 domain-containing protein [Labilithrix sp.]